MLAVVLIYVLVNLRLVEDADACRRHQPDTLVRARVLSELYSSVAFELLDGTNTTCTILFSGSPSNSTKPGDIVYVYRSDAGECDISAQDKSCNNSILFFNLLFTLLGINLVVGLVWVIVTSVETYACKAKEPERHSFEIA